MKHRSLALCALLILSACSSADDSVRDDTSSTSSLTPALSQEPGTPADRKELIDQLARFENGFSCHIGSITVANRPAPSADFAMMDSYFRSSTDDRNSGLEILTLDGVSYARYTGSLLSDASPAHERVRRQVSSNWATAGIPDTITLEELPATPLHCLEWVSILKDSITEVRALSNGATRFRASTGDGTATGVLDAPGKQRTLMVTLNGDTLLHAEFFTAAGTFPGTTGTTQRRPEGKVVQISPEEYQALVGG